MSITRTRVSDLFQTCVRLVSDLKEAFPDCEPENSHERLVGAVHVLLRAVYSGPSLHDNGPRAAYDYCGAEYSLDV